MNYYLFEHEKIKVNLVFEETEIVKFTALWKAGYSVSKIADKMGRYELDICLLVVDRAEIGEIKQRSKGIHES